MAVTRFYLDRRGAAKDGKGSLLITLYHNHSTATFSTGIRISPSQWDGSTVTHISGKEAINAKLLKFKSEIDQKIAILSLRDNYSVMTASDIKSSIVKMMSKTDVVQGHPVKELFSEYISLGMKDNTKTIYSLALKKIEEFDGDNVTIEDIDYKWILSFDKFLARTQSVNGRSIYLRALRTICNYAIHTEITDKYPFHLFSIKSEPTRKRSVTIDKLRQLRDYPTSELNAMYRDYFFLMFYLIGINVKDLLLAKKSQLQNGRLEYIREKTNKSYSIKIFPEAEEIIRRYSGQGDYLLNAMDHCKYYQSFARQINAGLRNIGPSDCKEVRKTYDLFEMPEYQTIITPIIPDITTYYARHSWATIAYEIGIHSDIISQSLGHSFGNRTTMIYIRSDQSKVDEANRMVIDYLNGDYSKRST